MKNNLALLAEQFSIEASEAQIIQAGLWDNPVLSAEFNVLNPADNRLLDIGGEGQKAFALQQLFSLGGKKSNAIELAKTNADIAKLELQDLLRTLKYQLRSSFFAMYYDQMVIKSISKQLSQLDTLIKAYTEQAAKGNLPFKDVVRLQSLYLTLQNNKTILNNNIFEEQKNLQTLLNTSTEVMPAPLPQELQTYQKPMLLSVDSLQNLALQHRPDAVSAAKSISASKWNLALQQSFAIPDLTLGASYDQRGGAFGDQINLTIGITLPLWNRNQGNIAVADAQLGRAKTLKDAQFMDIRNQVALVYRKYGEATKNFQSLNPTTEENFEAVYNGMVQNFQRRNVTMIEFTDFIESYTSSIVQIAEIRKTLTKTCEELNLTTSFPVF